MIRAIAAFLIAALSAVAVAQTPPVRVRGTVQKLDNNVLTVKARDGSVVSIKLVDNFVVLGITKAKLADVATGKFIIRSAQNYLDMKVSHRTLCQRSGD